MQHFFLKGYGALLFKIFRDARIIKDWIPSLGIEMAREKFHESEMADRIVLSYSNYN